MPTSNDLAAALTTTIGLLQQRMRAVPPGDSAISLPQRSALARLDRSGPTTAAALAKLEGISPQSMGSTLAGLVERGLVRRTPDPDDRRKALVALTTLGTRTVHERRHARAEQLARILDRLPAADCRRLEAALPVLERLAAEL